MKQITLEQFKLVCIDDTFSDAEVEKIAGIVVLESKEDVEDFCNILHKYRPEVEKSLNYEISEKRTRTTAF